MAKESKRALAYIVTIDEIKPIPNYDRVEHARTRGWWVVVKKEDFMGIPLEIVALIFQSAT